MGTRSNEVEPSLGPLKDKWALEGEEKEKGRVHRQTLYQQKAWVPLGVGKAWWPAAPQVNIY